MSRPPRTLIYVAALLWLAACSGTTFISTWKEPSAQPVSLAGKTVAALFVSNNVSQRRAAEVYLANDLTIRGAHGVTAYTLLPDEKIDGEAAKARLKEAGVDGVVVMRVVGKDQQINYNPGTSPSYYGGFGPYYNYGWNRNYIPPSVSTDTLISVETMIYSLKQDKLLWAGTSRTTNPDNLNALIDEVADAVAKQVAKQGLVAK